MAEDNTPEKKSVPPKLKVPQMKVPDAMAKPKTVASQAPKQPVGDPQQQTQMVDLDAPTLRAPKGPLPGAQHHTQPVGPKRPARRAAAPKTISAPRMKAPSRGGRDESSSQTIHIQLPDLDLAAPPVDAGPKTKSARPVAAPKTVRLKAPGSVQVKKFATGIVEAEAKEEGVSVKDVVKKGGSAGGVKRHTTKVPLKKESSTDRIPAKAGGSTDRIPAKAAAGTIVKRSTGVLGGPKGGTGVIGAAQTVRIQPMAAPGAGGASQKVPAPGSSPMAEGHEPLSDAQMSAAKRKTSRISLEAALSGADAGAEGQPKTVRLKRPSEAATVKVKRPGPPPVATPKTAEITPASAAEATGDRSSATDKIPASVAAAAMDEAGKPADVPLTRRKTIRVKRPSASSGVSAGGDGDEAQAAPEGVSMPPTMPMAIGTESVNPVFPVFAVATILVAVVTVWMFLAHALGPDDSLTRVSYGASGFDISWIQE